MKVEIKKHVIRISKFHKSSFHIPIMSKLLHWGTWKQVLFCKFLGIYFHHWVSICFFTLIFSYPLYSVQREIEEVLSLLIKVLWIHLASNTLVLLAILTRVIGMVATNLIKVHYNLCSSMSFVMLFLYCLINQIELLRALFNSQIVGNENKKPRVIIYIYI